LPICTVGFYVSKEGKENGERYNETTRLVREEPWEKLLGKQAQMHSILVMMKD